MFFLGDVVSGSFTPLNIQVTKGETSCHHDVCPVGIPDVARRKGRIRADKM